MDQKWIYGVLGSCCTFFYVVSPLFGLVNLFLPCFFFFFFFFFFLSWAIAMELFIFRLKLRANLVDRIGTGYIQCYLA